MNKIIVITGPTGVGKTKLSVSLAKRFNGEIINADSVQIYKCFDIGSAKITEEEKEGIPHHLFDIKNPLDNYTIFDYQSDAREKIDEIKKRGKTVILVGGSGLYIKACLFDYQLNKENTFDGFNDLSNQELFEKIHEINPNSSTHVNNRKRLVRELNKYLNGGKNQKSELIYDAIFIGLTTDRETLYKRINARVDDMIKNGLIEEVRNFYDLGYNSKEINTAIGYKELYEYFNNKITLDTAIEKIKKSSRNYAKRQYTFFNNQLNVKWFNVDFNFFDNTIENTYKYIKDEMKD